MKILSEQKLEVVKSSEIVKFSDKLGTRYIQATKYLDIYCFNLVYDEQIVIFRFYINAHCNSQ